MEISTTTTALDLDARLSRSQGRGARKFSATAKLTKPELQELERRAAAQGMTVSEWAREVLLREARSSRSDALFTEVVALRMMLNNLLRPLSCGEVITPDDFNAQMMNIRTTKQKVAQEILQQYTATNGKEQ